MLEALGSEEKRAILAIQTEVLRTMTESLLERGFTWILPVMLAKVTDPLWPDPGASIEKRVEFEIYGKPVRTMQSMIIHKMTLASLGPKKFFALSPNIRIETRERAKTGSHLYEFTQLEIEIAQGGRDDVFRVFEALIKESIRAVKERMQDELKTLARDLTVPETPFKVYARPELEKKYGKQWAEVISEKATDPVWVTDIPREFYDFEDERSGTWHNFDLFLPEGYGETISGAEREHEHSKILRKLRRDGLKEEDYQFLLTLAKNGKLKPSAGAGLGIERFVRYVCGAEHVAQVQPFPRVPGIVPEL